MSMQFFASESLRRTLTRAIDVLASTNGDKASYLRIALTVFSHNAERFDQLCAYSIESVGSMLQDNLEALVAQNASSEDAVDMVIATAFYVAVEFDLSVPAGIGIELRRFVGWTSENAGKFKNQPAAILRQAHSQLPVSIFKKLLHSDVLQNLSNMPEYLKGVKTAIDGWTQELDDREKRVNELRDALSKHESGFNFVGLYKGFDDLSVAKKSEIRWLRGVVIALAAVVMVPLLVELVLLFLYRKEISTANLSLLISVVPAVSVTVILIYYFRLAVRSYEGAKSQLSQIELRKTMCRFIESYAEFSKRLKPDNAETLKKFENLIFSNIVGSDEKLPATFDGIEQLSSLIKSARP